MNANTIYLGAHITIEFYLQLIARFLRNLTAQLEATEHPEKRSRFIGDERVMGEQQARESLRDGEELHYDDEERQWRAVYSRPLFELDPITRKHRQHLQLAIETLQNVSHQCAVSRHWQGARNLQHEHEQAAFMAEQSSLFGARPMYPDAPKHPVPVIEFVVPMAELIALLEFLAKLDVNPHEGG